MNEATVALLLLGNAITSLATLHRMGAWKDDPASISAATLPRDPRLRNMAQDELAIWQSTGPDALCRLVTDTTAYTVTRQTIIERAIDMAKKPYNRKIALHECDY